MKMKNVGFFELDDSPYIGERRRILADVHVSTESFYGNSADTGLSELAPQNAIAAQSHHRFEALLFCLHGEVKNVPLRPAPIRLGDEI